MLHRHTELGQRVLDGVDLMIDLATLGEYGLEPQPAVGPCRKQSGRRTSGARSEREVLATARRGVCGARVEHARRRPLRSSEAEFRFDTAALSRPVDFRGALEHYGAAA